MAGNPSSLTVIATVKTSMVITGDGFRPDGIHLELMERKMMITMANTVAKTNPFGFSTMIDQDLRWPTDDDRNHPAWKTWIAYESGRVTLPHHWRRFRDGFDAGSASQALEHALEHSASALQWKVGFMPEVENTNTKPWVECDHKKADQSTIDTVQEGELE